MSEPSEARSAFRKYRPARPVALPDRTWPDKTLTAAPRWCSVDLRDGNQALATPMSPERKLRMFRVLVEMGFKEIEVGFPAASRPDFTFVRALVDSGEIPDDVTIQVLTQARAEQVDRALESIRGARRAIVHVYNSTSPVQRRVVLGLDRRGTIELAVRAVERVREGAAGIPDTDVRLQYSPESFTSTELDFALDICEAVKRAWEPTPERPIILNLPATVEVSTPNVFADRVEWFGRQISGRESVVISVHPHNDRGCGIAAAELAVLAGADRVEGTLFGNGERSGNVDLVTLALNLHTQGVDPQLAIPDIDRLVHIATECTQIPVHPRHPWAGALVYTAFSGSHQDAIHKGMTAYTAEGDYWEVPYLPIDPRDVGRSYEAVIRITSQSGKGGVAHVLEQVRGIRLPRTCLRDFADHVQKLCEESGGELTSHAILEGLQTLYEGDGQEYDWNTPIQWLQQHNMGLGTDGLYTLCVEAEALGLRRWGVGRHADREVARRAAANSAVRRIAQDAAGARVAVSTALDRSFPEPEPEPDPRAHEDLARAVEAS